MAHYSRTSPEYRSNGHYVINGVEFMSIWTFKKKHNTQSNYSELNGKEGQELINKRGVVHTTTPDFGNFDKIFIYPVKDLEKYYGI